MMEVTMLGADSTKSPLTAAEKAANIKNITDIGNAIFGWGKSVADSIAVVKDSNNSTAPYININTPTPPTSDENTSTDKTMLYVGGGVAALILIVLLAKKR